MTGWSLYCTAVGCVSICLHGHELWKSNTFINLTYLNFFQLLVTSAGCLSLTKKRLQTFHSQLYGLVLDLTSNVAAVQHKQVDIRLFSWRCEITCLMFFETRTIQVLYNFFLPDLFIPLTLNCKLPIVAEYSCYKENMFIAWTCTSVSLSHQ